MYINKINLITPTYSPQQNKLSHQNQPKSTNITRVTQLPSYNFIDKSLVHFASNSVLDKYIGGYEEEKSAIDRFLISPINNRESLYPSVLLSFPDNAIERKVLDGLKKELNAYITEASASDKDIINTIIRKKMHAKALYLYNKQPTVLFINDAEKLIGMSPAYAKSQALYPMNERDLDIIRNNGINETNINFFKNILDEDENSNNDMTIVFVSKAPQYIHPDLFTRDSKVKRIFFPFVRYDEIKNVISKSITALTLALDDKEKNISIPKQIIEAGLGQKFTCLSSDFKEFLNLDNFKYITTEDLSKLSEKIFFDSLRYNHPQIDISNLADYYLSKFQKEPTEAEKSYKKVEILLGVE